MLRITEELPGKRLVIMELQGGLSRGALNGGVDGWARSVAGRSGVVYGGLLTAIT